MEVNSLEPQFVKTQRELEASTKKITEVIKDEGLKGNDRIRLTRVLQIVDRHKPKGEVVEDFGEVKKEVRFRDRLRSYLETRLRFFDSGKLPEKQEVSVSRRESPINDISVYSYMLSEQTIALLRELRRIDFDLRSVTQLPLDKIPIQERSSVEVIKEEVLDTSITLEYQKKEWGVERICLDGIQNHLPADSKGENFWALCLVDGKWIPLTQARLNPQKIRAVRFADDGVGFDVRNLALLYSTKAEEQESAGQFGEGMKMMAAAAVREGLDVEIESQNWRAKPIAKDITLTDTRHGKRETIQQLAFNAQDLAGEPIIGSRTTFWNPTPSFIGELIQLDRKVLALRSRYHPVLSTEFGEIADKESGKIFVKGIYVCNVNTLLSYNFSDMQTNRDRNTVDLNEVDRRIKKIMTGISDPKLVSTLLKKSILTPEARECTMFFSSYDGLQNPEAWAVGFYEAFGKDAVLNTGFKIPEGSFDTPINIVKLPETMTKLLLIAGVNTDRGEMPDFYKETIPTSVTIEYGKDVWDEERILLDAIQNHLPKDSGGSEIGFRFQTADGIWHGHDYRELEGIQDDQITAIEIYDNGKGYDYRLLGFFHSTKNEQESAGKFGEGLKVLCVAAMRRGIAITLKSQSWTASTRIELHEIDGEKIQQLVYDVSHDLRGKKKDDRSLPPQGSSTIFHNPTPQLIREFRDIHKKVLLGESNRRVDVTPAGEIVSLEGGLLFVKQLLIPGDHNLAFSYHLPDFVIKNRDRNVISRGVLGEAISSILSQTESSEFIRSFLLKANDIVKVGAENYPLEYNIAFFPNNPENWKSIFLKTFGSEVAICPIDDIAAIGMEAMNKHLGFETIFVPRPLYRILSSIKGIDTYESAVKRMTDVEHIPLDDLSREEVAILEFLPLIDKYLPNNRPSKLIVYVAKSSDQKVAAGFSNGIDIYLHRDTLSELLRAVDVYIHEKTHHNTTGAKDTDPAFRDYLTLALAKLALEQLHEIKPEVRSSNLAQASV